MAALCAGQTSTGLGVQTQRLRCLPASLLSAQRAVDGSRGTLGSAAWPEQTGSVVAWHAFVCGVKDEGKQTSG